MNGTDTRFQKDVTAVADGFSEPVYFPRRVNSVTVQARPSPGGTATVYYTMDAQADVAANPDGARWEQWDPGQVGANTTRAMTGPVTALRLGAVAADALMQVVGTFDF